MPTESSPMTAADFRHRLDVLLAERRTATVAGLGGNARYSADLELEIAVTEAAYVAAAVTEIASLRSALDAPLLG